MSAVPGLAPLLAEAVGGGDGSTGGAILLALIAAVAFATIHAVWPAHRLDPVGHLGLPPASLSIWRRISFIWRRISSRASGACASS